MKIGIGLTVNGCVTNPATPAPSGAPAWLSSGAVAGLNFMTGELWLSDTLITDLTTNVSFDGAYMTPAGYDMRHTNTVPGLEVLPGSDLLAFLQQMNWAVRMEFDLSASAVDQQCFISGWNPSTGFEGFIFSGSTNLVMTDYGGNYNTVGNVTNGQINVIAASNNPEGWLTSVNGSEALLDNVQTAALPNSQIFLGGNGTALDTMDAILRKYEFFPLQNAAQLATLSA